MARRRKVRDNTLIDALEALPAKKFNDPIWRLVRGDRSPLFGSAPKGRWDDGTFDVLYTSTESSGALAEIYFHLERGQPVFPSQMEFRLYELEAVLSKALTLADMASLEALGVETATYGSLEYALREDEYRRTQEIAEAAHFLDFDGLIVPNARRECHNVILFTDRVPPDALSIIREHGPVDWLAWKQKNRDDP